MNRTASLPLIGFFLTLPLTACGNTIVASSPGGAAGAGAMSSTTGNLAAGGSAGAGGTLSSTTGLPGTTAVSSSTGPGSTSASTDVAVSVGVTTVGSSSSGGFACSGSEMPLSGPCAPTPACMAGGSVCLAHVDQAGSGTPGFRISDIGFSKPAAFTTGVITNVVQGAALPNDPSCNLDGSGTFSWLLRFDLAAGTIETGGSKPAPTPAGVYPFITGMVQSNGHTFDVHPVTTMGALSGTCTFGSAPADVVIPLYLDPAGQNAVYLPLHALTFLDGTVTPDLGCIGRYDAEGLDPTSGCQPDAVNPSFLPGAALTAHITLEDADAVVVSALNETLCVLLSNDAAQYGTQGQSGVTVCKRDPSGAIVFKGDWCDMLDQPAITGCADAMRVEAKFAAQAVKIQ